MNEDHNDFFANLDIKSKLALTFLQSLTSFENSTMAGPSLEQVQGVH